jgi:hypothetical protein
LVGSPERIGEGEYKITLYRGSGKRGHVFRAETKDGRVRALKFVSRDKLTPNWEEEGFKAAKLEQQPNTVKFYQLFIYAAKYAVMVFDYVAGDNLRELIEKKALTVPHVERILRDLLFFRRDCLQLGVRHGDLHPGNIILRKPLMGPPRKYEVLITDFGIGYTGALLEPKDDFEQIGRIATLMLQSIRREGLDHLDRVVYDDLCRGPFGKKLREMSPFERGDEEPAITRLLEELADIRSRASETETVGGLRTSFGDYLAGEQLGSRWDEWEHLFVAGFPGYNDIVSRNITILTGTRGCGKTVVFRRLSALLAFEVGPVDHNVPEAFVGFYINMNDVADAFLFGQRGTPNNALAKRIVQFLHLCLLSEITRVTGVALRKASEDQKEAYGEGSRWLFDLVAGQVESKPLYPGPDMAPRTLMSVIEKIKDEVRASDKPSLQLASLAEADWLKRFVPGLQRAMPWIGERPVYFFVDDYSLPRVNKTIQTVLNSVLFQRSDVFFFKISTESPSTFFREDYSGKVLQDPDDFELTDLCSVTIDLSDEAREQFLEKVFQRRFAREDRLKGKTLADILGEFDKSWAQLARDIRKEPHAEGSTPAGTSERTGRVLYYGRKVFLSMWSGDTREMLRIALNFLEQHPSQDSPPFSIGRPMQDKVFRLTGGEFLHHLEACTRTSQRDGASLPPHITSWGKHLVKVAQGFKEIALHELHTRDGGREGRHAEPKQAFRIEIVDQFTLKDIEREIYEDLVRYGVFLRDDRGKSIRGAIIPRLYLRRLLIPCFTLTFSKVDNIPINCGGFKRLLMDPEQFAKSWKKDRSKFTSAQEELFK